MNLQEEHRYLFLKRCCQVLTEMGRQLCALWVSVDVSVGGCGFNCLVSVGLWAGCFNGLAGMVFISPS